jgi:hypothetical protein
MADRTAQLSRMMTFSLSAVEFRQRFSGITRHLK